MPAETYVHAGGSFTDIASCHTKVGGSWANVDTIYAKAGGVWEVVWRRFTLDLSNVTVISGQASTSAGGTAVTARAGIRLLTDGVAQERTTSDLTAIADAWGRPVTSGIGNNYHARLIVNSGDGPTVGTAGTWQQISSNKEWTIEHTDNASTSKSGNWTLQISPDGGSTVEESATFDVLATVIAV